MFKYLAALLLVPAVAVADLPKELSMPTDVGKVAITVNECPVKNKHGFIYEAYATEYLGGNVKIHKGCWYKDGDIVNIWFYNEEPPFIATYKDYYFKPNLEI